MATPPTSQKPDHETHHPPYETFNTAGKATRVIDQTETNRKNWTSHLDNFVCYFQIF